MTDEMINVGQTKLVSVCKQKFLFQRNACAHLTTPYPIYQLLFPFRILAYKKWNQLRVLAKIRGQHGPFPHTNNTGSLKITIRTSQSLIGVGVGGRQRRMQVLSDNIDAVPVCISRCSAQVHHS